MVLEMKPTPNAYGFMIGSDGCYFVHPDRKKTIKKTILTPTDDNQTKAVNELGNEMVNGKKRATVILDKIGCFKFTFSVGDLKRPAE